MVHVREPEVFELIDNGGEVSGPTILVADDDADLLLLMTRRLSKAGYQVISASDGQQALELVEEFLPEMAVLDVLMPKLTGIEVVLRLRSDPATHDMLIMLISAGFRGAVDGTGTPAGADVYFRKPFLPGELGKRVTALFDRRNPS